MKTLFVLFAALAFVNDSIAQARMFRLGTDTAVVINHKVWTVKTLTIPLAKKNGSTVMPNATLKDKDGNTTIIANGICIDESGNLIKIRIDSINSPLNYLFLNDGKMILVTKAIKTRTDIDENVRMVDGRTWLLINMANTMTTKNGTTVMTDGTIETKDGKTIKMKNGDCIDENGNMMKIDGDTKPLDCMYMYNGVMMSMTAITKEVTLKNGITITADGTIKNTNGTATNKMVEGGFIDLDGTMLLGRMPEKK